MSHLNFILTIISSFFSILEQFLNLSKCVLGFLRRYKREKEVTPPRVVPFKKKKRNHFYRARR